MTVPVVAYCAKSSPDERGSLASQLAEVRAAVEREGDREIVATFEDEAASAWRRCCAGSPSRRAP